MKLGLCRAKSYQVGVDCVSLKTCLISITVVWLGKTPRLLSPGVEEHVDYSLSFGASLGELKVTAGSKGNIPNSGWLHFNDR